MMQMLPAIDAHTVPMVFRNHPFAKPVLSRATAGATIGEIVAAMPDLPESFDELGIVCVNSIEVPRDRWHLVKPRADRNVLVQIGVRLQGGGGSGGKSILRIVAVVALLIAAVAIGPAGLLNTTALGTGLLGAGTITGAQLLAAGHAQGNIAVRALSKFV